MRRCTTFRPLLALPLLAACGGASAGAGTETMGASESSGEASSTGGTSTASTTGTSSSAEAETGSDAGSTGSSTTTATSSSEGTSTGSTDGSTDSDGDDDDPDEVVPEDVVLLPPVAEGPILAPITGYELSNRCPLNQLEYCEAPIYTQYDRDEAPFWDVLVDELLLSRVPVVMMHGRGCIDPETGTQGNGNMCPRLLSHLVDAVERAGAQDVIRFGMWDDTGAYPGTRNVVEGLAGDTPFDLGDPTSWRFFWDHNMKVWFDTVPPELWYRHDGHPVIAFWSLADAFFSNQEGNASALLDDLRDKFMERYGEEPEFIVDFQWTNTDSTLGPEHAVGMNRWFTPPPPYAEWYTYAEWGGAIWGATVPAFRLPNNLPGCGGDCWEILRRDGDALREALDEGAAMGSVVTLLEGWTDIYESAGYYRSDAWRFPNQYIGIVREYAERDTPTLRFQAEGADLLSTQTDVPDLGASHRIDVPNVARLPDDSGWFVDFTDQSGWLEYSEVGLGCGRYRFTARVNLDDPHAMHLEIDGQPLADRQATGGSDYELVHLGSVDLEAGPHDLRLVVDAGVRVDWFFMRRLRGCP